MGFGEVIRMAWNSLTGHKTRSALTLLGMVIGVFAIIVSVTAVSVIDSYFNDRVNFLGSSTFTISRFPSIQTGPLDPSVRNRAPITYEQVRNFQRAMNLPVRVSPLEDFAIGKVVYRDKETDPKIGLLGSDENFLENFSYELELGRFLTEQDILYARPVTVIGHDVADRLFPSESPLGKVVRLDGRKFEVVGTLKSKGSFLGFSQDNRIIVPITRLMDSYGEPRRNIATISVRVANNQMLGPAMDEATGRLRTIRRDLPGKPNSFEIDTNDTMRSFFDAFTGTLTLGGAFIGLIALLAAGIGIMNIMLVSVTERTREIGIRKSIGARRRDIMRQFLIEAFFLCQVGGMLGVFLGVLVGNLVAIRFGINAAIPWGWVWAAFFLVTIISLVFGGYPAFKAARLDPIESLRYE